MPNTKPAPPYAKGRVSALGVFSGIDTVLARHRQKTSLAISLPLQGKIRVFLSTLGIKNIPPEKLNQIVAEIAQETIAQTFEDLARVETPEQIIVVLADSLTQAIINHPDLANQIKVGDNKIFTKIVPQAQEIYTQNQDVLEKAAVLTNLSSIAKLQVGSAQVKNLINDSVEQTVEIEAPLTPPKQREVAKADLANYLTVYKEELAKPLIITLDNIPTLKTLQEAKENAHTQATGEMTRATIPISPKPTTAIPPKILTDNLAKFLYLKPPRPTSAPPKLPPGGNLILTSPTRVRDAYLSLLSLDQEKLARALKETSEEIERYKNKKSLSYRERRAYQDALKKQARYVAAQAFHAKQPKAAGAYRTLFARAFGGRAEVASQQAWIAENYFLTSMPRVVAHNERLAAGAAFGSLGFHLAGFNLGSIFSKIRGQALANITVGMGISPATPVKNLARKITAIAGGVAGGLLLYFASLGQAALAGALIGGTIGATTGAIVGGAIPVAMLGPAGVLLWPVTVPLGIATGGLVGIVAGGLIGLGIAAGSTTAISMGVGASIGGVVGGYIGLGIGSAISGAFITFAAAACAATGLGCILIPIAAVSAPIITAVSTAIGALVGAAVGAAIGYVIGHYVLSTLGAIGTGAALGFVVGGPLGAALGAGIGWLATGGWTQLKNFFSATPGAVTTAGAGFFGAVGGFFTGLASTIWGGITSFGGGVFGFFSGAANFVVGGLGSLVVPASAAAIPVAGGIGAVAVGGTIVGIVAATSFFTTEADIGIPGTGENTYFSVTKAATPVRLENDQLPHDLTFTIRLTAKETKLTNITIADKIDVQKESESFPVTEDKNGRPVPPLGEDGCPAITELEPATSWECQFIITATTSPKDFRDSAVLNTVAITATPENQQPVTDFTSVIVIIGTPPSNCPTGWPVTHGRITQGPQGSASHNDLRAGGEEAIDIGDNPRGTPTFATFSGTVLFLNNDENASGYGKYVDIQGICGDITFKARWAHLNSIDAASNRDSQVVFGQRIGTIDNTGYSDGDHLHYSFWGLPMAFPHIPQTPTPPSCEDGPTPCNISW